MDTGISCNKEMVDLLMRIKRHAKSGHGVSVNMSDKNLMEKLVSMATIDDDLLQGMLQYFMVLAGGSWSKRYDRARGTEVSHMETFARRVKEAVVTAPPAVPAAGSGRKVRYYRGQPIYG